MGIVAISEKLVWENMQFYKAGAENGSQENMNYGLWNESLNYFFNFIKLIF